VRLASYKVQPVVTHIRLHLRVEKLLKYFIEIINNSTLNVISRATNTIRHTATIDCWLSKNVIKYAHVIQSLHFKSSIVMVATFWTRLAVPTPDRFPKAYSSENLSRKKIRFRRRKNVGFKAVRRVLRRFGLMFWLMYVRNRCRIFVFGCKSVCYITRYSRVKTSRQYFRR